MIQEYGSIEKSPILIPVFGINLVLYIRPYVKTTRKSSHGLGLDIDISMILVCKAELTR
jgi:hypothetical protein